MMFWLDRHRRLRDQLSAYIDGALDTAAAERLEAHLDDCESCRRELEQLRSTVSALRELPEAQVPRSFALSAERAAARRPSAPSVPLVFGVRIAAAGVAVALAAVLVVDIGNLGGGAAPAVAPAGTVAERQADQSALSSEDTATAGEEAKAAGGAAPEASGTAAEATGETPEAESGGAAPQPSGTPTFSAPEAATQGAESADTYKGTTGADETPAAAPEENEAPAASGQAEATTAGGIDALTAAEIGLTAALGVLVVGSLIFALATRKR
jgi:hypothetical protein